MENRDLNIDILRFIGTLLIILAHVGAPLFIHNLRTFDVVLLILLSGISLTRSKSIKSYGRYLKSRVKKMVIPIYIVLTIIFLMNLLSYKLLGISSEGVNLRAIVGSYLLLDGIGYVWVVRIFLVIAIVAPFFPYIVKNISFKKFLVNITLLYIGYIVMISVFKNTNLEFINVYVLQSIPYILIAIIGYRIAIYKSEVKKMLLLFLGGLLLAFSINYSLNLSILPDFYKYPPQHLYLFYGLFVSLSMYFILEKYNSKLKVLDNKFLRYVSVNSFEIYVYHILAIFIYNALQKILNINFSYEFIVKYLFVLLGAIALVYIKQVFVNLYSFLINNNNVRKIVNSD